MNSKPFKEELIHTQKVSVIIPAYNSASTLKEAIDSVLDQGVEVEIIVMDDASKDNTLEVLKPYNDKIKIFTALKNQGVAYSRYHGIRHASHEWIAFLDSDDAWNPGKLKHQLQMCLEKDALICATARELANEHGESLNRILEVKDKITYQDILKTNSITNSSILMRKEVALEVPLFDSSLHEDYLMWLTLLKKYGYAIGINEPYVRYRISSTSKSGNKLKSAKMHFNTQRAFNIPLIQVMFNMIPYAYNGLKKHGRLKRK
ncbi:MAG: glycosyltransferase family 2 protein [Erysipelothrix sp.]|jgi:teichuronic acid biosynthesis glycosyltransferase TuaG|nr:glycosyltransferase family 2 protein [Erysipelothrix sp.]